MMVASYAAPSQLEAEALVDMQSSTTPTSCSAVPAIGPPRRVLCRRCARPSATCVCAALPPSPIALTTRVLVLQHPREAKKPIGSVRLLPLCLKHVHIVEAAVPWLRGSEPLHAPSQLDWLQRCMREGYEPLLLFPSEGAIALDERHGRTQRDAPADESGAPSNDDLGDWRRRPSGWSGRTGRRQEPREAEEPKKKVLLVMIDGTWSQARHLLRHSPTMAAACTHVKFEAEREAIIGALRREPERHCTSTLEACARMLRVVEPTAEAEAAAAHMEAALSVMVEAQNQFRVRRPMRSRYMRPLPPV